MDERAAGSMKHINIQLDRRTFEIVLRTLAYMEAHDDVPAVVDYWKLMMGREELKGIVRTLEAHVGTGEGPVTIRMNSSDWTAYSGFLMQASRSIPQKDATDYETLFDLVEKYGQLELDGLAPDGP